MLSQMSQDDSIVSQSRSGKVKECRYTKHIIHYRFKGTHNTKQERDIFDDDKPLTRSASRRVNYRVILPDKKSSLYLQSSLIDTAKQKNLFEMIKVSTIILPIKHEET